MSEETKKKNKQSWNPCEEELYLTGPMKTILAATKIINISNFAKPKNQRYGVRCPITLPCLKLIRR